MTFSSLIFLFFFFTVTFLLQLPLPVRGKNAVLVAASLFFYAWGEPVYILLMLFSILVNYLAGLDIDRRETRREKVPALVFGLALNLAMLFFFKYYAFATETVNALLGLSLPVRELPLPIGISFYTFQAMSYLIDVCRGEAKGQRNLLSFALYITMFPQLVAGPIVKYTDLEPYLASRRVTRADYGEGMARLVRGLAKKVLLANQLGQFYTAVQGMESRTVLLAWLGIAAYTMQIYFDFSGYSDMAVGMGRLLGFPIPENFRHPYLSRSVTEFWRRWHISLSSWFRDYVYIPLGGNRCSRAKHLRNILTVWLLTGLWHGASWNFVLWGLYYGVLLILEKYVWGAALERLPGALRRVYTLVIVALGWVLFSCEGIAGVADYLGSLFGVTASGFADAYFLYELRSNLLLLALGALCCTEKPSGWLRALSGRRPVLAALGCFGALLGCVAYLVSSSYNPFLYFRF